MKAKGSEETLENVLTDILQRDFNDSTREINPLKKAEDAEEIDTSNMTIEEVVDYLYNKITGDK